MRLSGFAMRYGWALGLVVALAAPSPGWGIGSLRDDSRQEPDAKLLIAELASPEFEVRRLAQEQLQSLGLGAFDALLEAQFHADVEVAHRARFILRSMAIEWVKESDPKEVKQILKGYGKSDPVDRRPQIESLARLDEQRGVPALCRLSNYEFDPVLSKFAALQVMQIDLSESPNGKEQVIRAIEAHVRPSGRPAAKWLREYAHWLAAPKESLPIWKKFVEEEKESLQIASPNTSREMTGWIHLWYADALRSQSQEAESLAILRQTLDFISADEMQVRDAVVGLIARGAHSIVDEAAAKFGSLLENNAYLCYLHAESLRSRPRPAGESLPQARIDQLTARAIELGGDRFYIHRELAEFLEARGQFDWFEAESRLVFVGADPLSNESIQGRSALAELLGELERYEEAAEVLRPVADEFNKAPADDFRSNFVLARYYLFLARAAGKKQNTSEQKAYLRKAVDSNLEDSDVIIDMYRVVDTDENWKKLTADYMKSASKKFEENVKKYEAEMAELQGNEKIRAELNDQIAVINNQYAWLIANTAGDFDKAIAMSRQSLEIKPNLSTYQDTLARCYYAKGDYENALKYQKLAVKQEPFAPAMRRQMALFENAVKKQPETSNEKK